MSNLLDAQFSVEEVYEVAKADLDFLSALSMPDIFTFGWPPTLKAAWSWLVETAEKERDFSNLALGLPRGFGKTTLVKLYIVYCILFTKKQFILIMSATAGLAENIISDVADILDEPNIRAVFGDWRAGMEKDTNALKKFAYRGKNCILAAIGAGGTVRGLNLKNERPDVMIFEDVQSREDADSQKVSDDLYRWMLGTAMKAKSPKGCTTLFIANMYPTPHSILKKLKANPYWVKFIVGGILQDGTSLWEDLQPIAQLLREYRSDVASGHPEIFHAEVLNDEEASVNNLLDLNALPEYPFEDNDIDSGSFIVIDPATDKANADAVTVAYFQAFDERPVAREIVEGRLSPLETIQESIKLCMKHGCSVVFIESNAYQYSLKFWSEKVCKDLGIEGITFIDIYSGRASKNSRILTMFKSYAKGEFYVHEDCRAQVHSQIRGFNPLKTDNVDGILDCLTYAPKIIAEHGELIKIRTILGQLEISQGIQEDDYFEGNTSPF